MEQFICSNISAVPAHRLYISQLIRYSRECGSYQDFLDRVLLLTRKLLFKLKSSLRKFYGRHHDLFDHYGISLSQMTTDMFHLPFLSSLMTYQRICGVRVTRSLVLCVCSVYRCLSLCPFSFGHCVVYSSSMYGF